jgi:PIN domain nuclease of toxin-antitoxin system
MDRSLNLKAHKVWFIAVCDDCGAMRMPFSDGVERKVWTDQHQAPFDRFIGRTHRIHNIVEIWED